MRAKTYAVAAFAALQSFGASAATTLVPMAPGVLLSRGGGYEEVTVPTPVAPTDCILVNPGGRGELQFEDGTVKVVEAGDSNCVADLAALPDAGAGGGAVAGGGALASSTLLVGGLAVAGAVGLVGAVASGGGGGGGDGGGGGNPASP